MLRKKINKCVLEQNYPFDIHNIISKCKEFEIKCKRGITPLKTLENASDCKNLLAEILGIMLNKLRGLDLAKSDTERESWFKLQRDVSICSNFLDLREKELVTGTIEREKNNENLIVLLGDYQGVYRTMILNILKEAREVYENKIFIDKDITDKKKALFWVIYELMQINAGIYEMRINLSSGGTKSTKTREPWQGMLVQSMRNELRETREMRVKQMLGEEVMKLVEKFNIPLSEEEKNTIAKEQGLKEKKRKDKSEDEDSEEGEDFEEEQEDYPILDEEPIQKSKTKKPKTGGKKMEDDSDEDEEDSKDDGDWEE